MVGIYKITNPKGRVYIGQSVDVEKRKRSYKNLRCKSQARLYTSSLKYGFSEHIFEVIEQCSIEILNERERYWQDFYEVLGRNGLNCTLTTTDTLSGKRAEETIKKMSESMKGKNVGKKRSRESIEKGLQTRKELGTNLHSEKTKRKIKKTLTGRVRPQEVRDKISKTLTGRANLALSKAVIQYTEDMEYIQTFNSISVAEQSTGVFNIGRCALGKQKTAGGFIWKYE